MTTDRAVPGEAVPEEFARAYAELLARTPEHDIAPGLDRIARVCELMGNPERSYRVIHLAGTNGKTTTARLIEHVLTRLELRTGRYTSPHLHSPAERISIDGAPISPEDFATAWEQVKPFIELVDAESAAHGGVPMTFFEAITALALWAFADAPCDVVVLETGLGGRLDATNVVTADVDVITPIALDHQSWLGDTLAEIAGEKAGIIDPDAITVTAAQEPEALAVVRDAAAAHGSRLVVAGEDFGLITRVPGVGGQLISVQGLAGRYDEVFLSLLGPHQADNATVAIAALEAFVGGGDVPLNHEVLVEAMSTATSPGRAEIVRNSPTVLVDGAHNPAGAEALLGTLRDAFRFTYTVGLVGILREKDPLEILSVLEPELDAVVVTRSTSPRAIPTHELYDMAVDVFDDPDRVVEADMLPDAVQAAVDLAEAYGEGFGGVVATGSITLAAEVRALFGRDREA